MKKYIGIVVVFILIMGTMGCSKANDSIAQLKESLQQDVVAQPSNSIASENQLEIPNMDEVTIEETYEPVQTMAESNEPKIVVDLYFASEDGQSLVKVEKEIIKKEGLARAAIEALIQGPETDSSLASTIPTGTKLLDINVKPEEGLCIVDFSKEISQQAAYDQINEEITVYSIANTLCQFASVEQVEFRVEGQRVSALDGNVDLSRAVSANSQIVK